jgi:hypothetical protein
MAYPVKHMRGLGDGRPSGAPPASGRNPRLFVTVSKRPRRQAQHLFSRPRETDDEREDSSQDQPSGPNLKEAERFRPICRRWRPLPHEGIIQLARKR